MASRSTKDRVIYIIYIYIAVFCLIILWEVINSSNSPAKHIWHILLCVFGVALCMAEGVQIFRKQSIGTLGDTRLDKAMAHLIVMGVAFVSITIGISLKISQKMDSNRSHFDTTHGILGLSSWIIAFIVALGGLVLSNSDRLNIRRSPALKLVHILFGVVAYILGIVSLGYGLHDYLTGDTNGTIFLIVLMSISVAYSLIGPCISLINFAK